MENVGITGYRPGAIGRVVALHATYYAAEWGFDIRFENRAFIAIGFPWENLYFIVLIGIDRQMEAERQQLCPVAVSYGNTFDQRHLSVSKFKINSSRLLV